MNLTESDIAAEMLENIVGAADEGAEMVAVPIDATSLEIVEAVNAFVSAPPPLDDGDNWDRSLPLGALWGQQLVRQLGWEWSSVTFHDHGDADAVGVFSQDRSLAIYPFHFIFGCLENDAPVTILLAFNMLLEGKIPPQQAKAYVNVMEGVEHIVPPG